MKWCCLSHSAVYFFVSGWKTVEDAVDDGSVCNWCKLVCIKCIHLHQ